MAKANTTIDEELYDGLQQARKKKPRYFALITKGADVVGLIVQKKKINDGQAAKAKAEAKGSGVITGVCQGQGVELTFEVLDAEPTIKTTKIKEFINEQTDLALKPQWAVVKALTEVKETDDETPAAPPGSPAPPVTNAFPPAPPSPQPQAVPEAPSAPPTGDPLAELSAKLKALTPAVQNAILANPARKNEVLGAVDTVKKLIKSEDAAGAQQSLLMLAKLLSPSGTAPGPQPVTPPPSPQASQKQDPVLQTPTSPDADEAAYAKAKAKFAAVRGVWIRIKDQAVSSIHTIRDAMFAEYKNVPELKANLARGVKELTEAAATFNDELKLKFDAFVADPPPPPEARAGLKREVLSLIDKYREEIETNSLYEDLDQKEFAQVLVKAPLLQALNAMAKDLA